MKGIIFSELLSMIDEKFSFEITERLIGEVNLPSGCAYTTVGTYNSQEIVILITKLSEITSVPINDLLKQFGYYLFFRFTKLFPIFFEDVTSTFDFLSSVETYIHMEVKKLYSDAKVPAISCVSLSPEKFEVRYYSDRNLPDLAEGLIIGTIHHFKERIQLSRQTLSEEPPIELFILTKCQNKI